MKKESKTQIAKHLNTYYVDEVRMIFAMVAGMLLRNPDFLFAIEECEAEGAGEYNGLNGYETPEDHAPDDDDNIISSIEMMTGRKPDFGFFDIVTPDELEILREIDEIINSAGFDCDALEAARKVKKAKMVEILSEVFSSDTLFEGFFLLLEGTERDGLDGLARELGVPARWEILKGDPVYWKRRGYSRLLGRYIKAALNLYGCIYVEELLDIIEGYEAGWSRPDQGYTREEGGYRHTFIFNPQWLCEVTLQEFADCCVSYSGMTLDGMLVHELFIDELSRETELLFSYMKELGHEPTEEDGNDYNDMIWNEIAYRALYSEARNKEMYLPKTKEAFLKFENRAETAAERKMRVYMRRNHHAEFEQYAKEVSEGMTGLAAFRADEDLPDDEIFDEEIDAEGALDLFMDLLCEMNGNGPDCMDMNPMDTVKGFFELLEDFGIVMNDTDEPNTVVGLLMNISNNTRLWTNHGYTPNELNALHPMKPGQLPTIRPMSSAAAQLLSEGRGDIEKIGFKIDLESGADEIPAFSMPQGIGGPMVKQVKKVYPNDPCPCGSGKKYKKCCGRRA